MGVTIKNLGRLQAKLEKLDPVTKGALAKGVRKAGLMVEGSAKMRAPVDTGALRASISGRSKVLSDGAESTIGTNIEYALYVEMGTRRMRAQPFLQPALQSNKKKARQLIMTEIVKAHRSL